MTGTELHRKPSERERNAVGGYPPLIVAWSPPDTEFTAMNSSLIITDSLLDGIVSALAAASGKWTGCDWSTQFGRSRLDLRDLHSSQATLMAQATAGGEAADWRDAVTWLKRVEQDASQAESEAQSAARLARSGKLRDALQCADRACAIEARYRKPLTWRPLRDAMEVALSKVERTHATGQSFSGWSIDTA
jgi:hypothetical protein